MLFSPVETISNKDITVKNSATSPLINPNPSPNTNPTSSVFPPPDPGDPKLHPSTPVGAVGPPRTKTNNSANKDLHPTPHTQEASSTTSQTLTSRICELKNCLPMKYQLIHLSPRGFILNTFSDMIKVGNLNPAIQALSFGRFHQ